MVDEIAQDAHVGPTTEEKPSIRAEIDAIDRELDGINAEVDTLSARLFVLRGNRSRLHDKRGSLLHRLGTTPLTLPAEILSDVFEFVTTTKSYRGYLHRDVKSSFLLSHVSQRWRTIALQNPFLWTHIYISQRFGRNLTHLLLDRSGTCPIDVELGYVKLEGEIQKTFDIVRSHAYRWSSFTLTGYWHRIAPILELLEGTTSPFLQHFAIFAQQKSGEGKPTLPKILFNGNAPALASLTIHNAVALAQPFDFPNLKSLGLISRREGVTVQDLTVMLSPCLLLEILVLELDLDTVPVGHIIPIVFPRLRILSLRRLLALNVPPLLSLISAPNLTELELYKMDGSLRHLYDYVTANMRSFPHLETLTLTHSGDTPRRGQSVAEELWDAHCILQSFTSISTLRTSGREWAATFLQALANDPNLCPTLAHIHCSDIDLRILQDLLIGREFSQVPIASIYFLRAFAHLIREQEFEWFRDRVPVVEIVNEEK